MPAGCLIATDKTSTRDSGDQRYCITALRDCRRHQSLLGCRYQPIGVCFWQLKLDYNMRSDLGWVQGVGAAHGV